MMVRINLVPGKKRSGVPGGDALWRLVAAMLVLLLAQLFVLYFIYDGKAQDVKRAQGEVQRMTADAEKLEREIAALPDVEKRAAELEARERTLARLASVRNGPQHVLDELKRVMSRPRDPASVKMAKDAGWNISWEAENVFLNKIVEERPGALQLEGAARGLDDVAELWLRLRTSRLFRNVRLASIKKGRDSGLGVDVQTFVFYAEANFRYQTKDGEELMKQLEAAASVDAGKKE